MAASAIDSAKARRIIEAMRASVGRRGVTGSTFDPVARQAGVSRGLLHYYFGTKERLLAATSPAITSSAERASATTVREDPDFVALVTCCSGSPTGWRCGWSRSPTGTGRRRSRPASPRSARC